MVLSNGSAEARDKESSSGRRDRDGKQARVRLAGEICNGRYRPGEFLRLPEIAARYQLDNEMVSKTFAEFQALGMVTLSGPSSAIVRSPNPKEMHEAYEIRAALEEIAGRSATPALKGNTAVLQRELDAMRRAFRSRDLDALAEHDVAFHRAIMKAAQNKLLLRVWDGLAFDLRIRGAIAKVAKDIPEIVESHQPIVDALNLGHAREAALLLRNHVETLLEFLKKTDSDSGAQRALRRDLEGARDVQEAFFPPRTISIPCISCETFYQPAHGIGGDYYDLLSLPNGRWGIAIGDVSGKGIGAALLMASLQASLRAQALHPHLDLSALIGDVNRLVYESSPAHLFASLFYAEYEPSTRTLKYVNAGHNPPMVLRWQNGSCNVYPLHDGGIPIGIDANSDLTTTTFQLEIGDVLVAYTDGVTEADNPEGELWGMQRFENLLRSCDGTTSQGIIDRILNEVTAFAKGQQQRDDVTLVVMSIHDGCDS